jgi:3-methyladenine DNA glycosylase Tag
VKNRCEWCGNDPLYIKYHDEEWGVPIINNWTSMSQLPATSPESEAMSKSLKSWGFSFVGPTICYAFMKAVGMVNDHTVDCFRYSGLNQLKSMKSIIKIALKSK